MVREIRFVSMYLINGTLNGGRYHFVTIATHFVTAERPPYG